MDEIGVVRRFNRTVTQRVGALSESYLGRDRALGASRVLWEIGADGCEVRALRSRLGLDSGHASRLLRALEREGLVDVVPGEEDRRVRVARLTDRGRAERAVLDDRSDALARDMLAPLDPGERAELVGAMRTVARLLRPALVELRVTDPRDPVAQAAVQAYFAELNRRDDSGFDPTAGASAEPHELTPPLGTFLVAWLDGEPVGCGGVKHRPGAPAEIKRLWVAERARGHGIGRRLLAALEEHAVRAGAATVRLDTNRTLVEAIAMYRSAGYAEIPRYNDEPFAHHWFEKRLAA